MNFYVIQVRTGREQEYLQRARDVLSGQSIRWPRRNLRIRRAGVWRDCVAPIFPGYLFLQAEGVDPELYRRMKGLPGFLRFLKDNQHIEPLGPRDREIVVHFLSYGEIVDRSKAVFDENRRIRVISGPLKDLEGRIVKVDRRKGRARVALELYESAFLIDFGFDCLEDAAAQGAQAGQARR
jgi:transcriptional antiterminator NusG